MSAAGSVGELVMFVALLGLAATGGWHLNSRVAPHPVAELRDLARVRDRVDGREESADERRVQALYGMDVLGCVTPAEATALRSALLAYPVSVGDSVDAVVFSDAKEYRQFAPGWSEATAFDDRVIVVHASCATPGARSIGLSELVHELAHVREDEIELFERTQPVEARGRSGDNRAFAKKWQEVAAPCGSYVGHAAAIEEGAAVPPGFVSAYATATQHEDVAETARWFNLAGNEVGQLSDRGGSRVDRVAALGRSARGKGCLLGKLTLLNDYRFLDRESATVIRRLLEAGRADGIRGAAVEAWSTVRRRNHGIVTRRIASLEW